MTSLKKNLPLVIAFCMGVIITYFFMRQAYQITDLVKQSSHRDKVHQLEAEISRLNHELNPESKQKEEKYWFDERMEKQSEETEERTKEQQSQGDALKSQFDQFSNE